MSNNTAYELKKWIEQKLGGPTVAVELEPGAIEAAVRDAFEWWASYKGFFKQDTLQVSRDQVSYDLSGHDPEVIDVVKVYFPRDATLEIMDGWVGWPDIVGVPYSLFPYENNAFGLYGGITQYYQSRSTAQRVLSLEPEYEFNQETKELVISPGPKESGTAIYVYSTPFKPEYLGYINPRDMMLIRRRALAEAKETLGYIRGKYESGLPAAQGSVTLDGSTLRSEAQDEKARLDELIMSLAPPTLPVIG